MELLRNAWNGWQNYTNHGKIAALLLLALVYLMFARGKNMSEGRSLPKGKAPSGERKPVEETRSPEVKLVRNYTIIMTVLCIFPLTAAVLMCYQTRFYDYEWIWSLVPVTAVVALGGTFLFWECGKMEGSVVSQSVGGGNGKKDGKKSGRKSAKAVGGNNALHNILLVAMLAALFLLCGRLGEDTWERQAQPQRLETAQQVLAYLSAEADAGEEICLWAPREVLEYARALDGRFKLLYGRNMWDISLNAYSYDKYEPDEEKLYLWMERTAQTGWWNHQVVKTDGGYRIVTEDRFAVTGAEDVAGNEQVTAALRMGANRILLKDNFDAELLAGLRDLASENHLEVQQVEGYLLLKR